MKNQEEFQKNDSDSDIKSQISVYSKDTYIYGWGKNTYGEMGLNTTDNILIPTPIKTFQSQIISSITSGGKNSIILTNEGKVYVSGSNIFGLLGQINQENQNINNEQYQKIFKPMKFFTEETIIQISCAEFHSLALNKEGNIYSWGGNLHNKLGQSSGIIGQPVLIQSLLKKKIISISCGDYHTCALTDNGELYSWGGGGQYNRGQCGHGVIKEVDSPKKVDFFGKNNLKVEKICCGGYHTIVSCDNGEIYSFGKGEYGQLGYGESQDTPIPKLVKFSQKFIQKYEVDIYNSNNNNNDAFKIVDFKCGGEHSVFLSNFGRVYMCGHGYHGQLGLGNTKNVNKPIIVMSLLKKVINKIAAGWSHTLVLTDEGIVYVTGCGKYGELGLGVNNDENNNMNKCVFTLLKSVIKMNVKEIFAGGHHSWCTTDNVEPVKENLEIPEPLEPPNYNIQRRNSNNSIVDKKRKNSNISNNSNNNNLGDNIQNKNKNIKDKDYLYVDNKGNFDKINQKNFIENNDDNYYEDKFNDVDKNIKKGSFMKDNTKKIFQNPNDNNFNHNNRDYNMNDDNFNSNELNSNYNNYNNDLNSNYNNYNNDLKKNNKNYISNYSEFNKNNNSINKNESFNPDFIFDNKKINLENLEDNLINYSKNQIKIQVIYTDLNLIHRFIRFEISETNSNFKLSFKELELKIKNYLEKDKANVIYRLQYNNEALDELNNSNEKNNTSTPLYGTLFQELKNYSILEKIDSNIKSYCLNIVYDPSKNPLMNQLKEELPKNNSLGEKSFIFKLFHEENISKDSENESILSGWIIDFYNTFYDLFSEKKEDGIIVNNDELENLNNNIPRFYELRPFIFYNK